MQLCCEKWQYTTRFCYEIFYPILLNPIDPNGRWKDSNNFHKIPKKNLKKKSFSNFYVILHNEAPTCPIPFTRPHLIHPLPLLHQTTCPFQSQGKDGCPPCPTSLVWRKKPHNFFIRYWIKIKIIFSESS